jgi:6-phosphogluconolactonase (cycloisomerase 2 family)
MKCGVQSRWALNLPAAALLALLFVFEIACGGASDPAAPPARRQVLYLGNQQANSVSGFTIGNDGSLTALPLSPFALGGNSLVADPNGKVLFSVGLNSDSIRLNSDQIGKNGSLQMLSTVTDNSLAGVRATNPAGTALYVSSANAAEDNFGWKIYSIQSDGRLQYVDGLIDQVAGHLVFSSDGSTAYSAYCYQFLPNIEKFSVAANGMLTNSRSQITTQTPFSACPNAVALSPAGTTVAAPWSSESSIGSGQNFITLHSIDPATHELNPPEGSVFPASGAGADAIFDSSGNFLLVAQDNGIGVYKTGNNSLVEVPGSPFGGAEVDRILLAPLGNFIVAISSDTGQTFVFKFNRSTGEVTLAPGSPIQTPTPTDPAIVVQ